MSANEEMGRGGDVWDAPNQQVVREDQSGPGDEGEPPAPENGGEPSLDEMTKAQLLAYAQELGVSPANNDMTKDEIRAGVDAKLAEGAA